MKKWGINDMLINTFTAPLKSSFAALDTETHTYVDGVILSEEEIRAKMTERDENGARKYPVKWWREHCRVEIWAISIYTPEGFAILESWEEYTRFVAQFGVKTAWWYNAPFDFAALDAVKLRSGWRFVTEKPTEPKTYGELASPFGARYVMTEQHPTNPAAAFQKKQTRKTRKLVNYDLRNLLKGGLDKLLKTFDVRDGDGNPIRKKTMKYQEASKDRLTYDDLLYMLEDVRGLWWLIDTFGRRLLAEYGINILKPKPDVITASSLAKRLLLRKMYPQASSDRAALKFYKKNHPLTLAFDRYARRGRLLLGGLVMINPRIRGKHLRNIPVYRFDYNNHYGGVLHDMGDIRGLPHIYEGRVVCPPDHVRIFEITNCHAMLRPGFIPAWINPILHEVTSEIEVRHERDDYILLYDFELEELGVWYDIDLLEISRTIIFNAPACPAFAEFVDEHYRKKADYKRAGDMVGSDTEKLINNGATGKFSQNPNVREQWRQLDEDGVVRLVGASVPDPDEGMIMNIFQGSCITAMARTKLRKTCRDIAFQAGRQVAEVVLYTDTDSVHTTVPYARVDPYKLGELKLENVDKDGNPDPILDAIFVAPKTYAEAGRYDVNFHCKGVNVRLLEEAYKAGEDLAEIYKIGREYLSNQAINVPGGKAILPFPKAVCRRLKGEIEENELYY